MLVEMVASGVLALGAPGAFWIGLGQYHPVGWLLWGLCWLQVAGTILHAYLRLEQRALKKVSDRSQLWKMGQTDLAFNLAVFVLALGLAVGRVIPTWTALAFAIQPLEVLWSVIHPAVGVKPAVIGMRQLAVSIIFTLAFILLWQLG